MTVQIRTGDCRTILAGLPEASVHSCVTDPPYGLSFMGKAWDYDVPPVETWREVLRVLKPGAHLLAFAGSRTYHRMVVAIEDAGFEIRDQIAWLYGSGFPKSHNIGNGWGTALKPAHEPIVVARKPIVGTVAANVMQHGCGALNIDGCRVGTESTIRPMGGKVTNRTAYGTFAHDKAESMSGGSEAGRWPANVIHDGSEEVLAGFPQTKSGYSDGTKSGIQKSVFGKYGAGTFAETYGDSGSAARFFYCAKASKADRDEGLATPEQSIVTFATANGTSGKPSSISEGRNTAYRNNHPTVKPTDLMRYLCRLVTPPGGTVLDPFMGSGSTGKAARLEQFSFVGIEIDPAYVEIARARIDGDAPLFVEAVA